MAPYFEHVSQWKHPNPFFCYFFFFFWRLTANLCTNNVNHMSLGGSADLYQSWIETCLLSDPITSCQLQVHEVSPDSSVSPNAPSVTSCDQFALPSSIHFVYMCPGFSCDPEMSEWRGWAVVLCLFLSQAFSKKKTDDRKEWLTNFMEDRRQRRMHGLPEVCGHFDSWGSWGRVIGCSSRCIYEYVWASQTVHIRLSD